MLATIKLTATPRTELLSFRASVACTAGLWVLLALTGCFLPEEGTNLKQPVAPLPSAKGDVWQQVQADLHRLQMEVQWLADQTLACKYRQYNQLLKEGCEPGRCNPGAIQRALNGLKELSGSYAVMRLRPEQAADEPTGKHLNLLRETLLNRAPRPMTRLLLVVMPKDSKNPQSDAERAQRVAMELRRNIWQRLADSRSFGWVEPTTVGCSPDTRRLFYDLAQRYADQLAQKGLTLPAREPRLEDSFIAILFRLDCFPT